MTPLACPRCANDPPAYFMGRTVYATFGRVRAREGYFLAWYCEECGWVRRVRFVRMLPLNLSQRSAPTGEVPA